MLEELRVEGLGAIDKAEFSLGAGCAALTGETGAGKTLLVVALGLLTGARADRSLVREGAKAARVEGRFSVAAGDPVLEWLAEQDLIDETGEIGEVVITRTVPADGASAKARVNGRLTTSSVLSKVGAMLVEIAGQHDQQRLGSPNVQRGLLDASAGRETVALAAEVAAVVRTGARLQQELEALTTSRRERERELDVLRYEVTEISAAPPEAGETDRLKRDASRLEHAEAITKSLGTVRSLLRGERGVGELLHDARRGAEEAAELDASLRPVVDRLETLAIEVEDIAQEASARDLAPDPQALAVIRDRLGLLASLKRKYGADEAAILAYLDEARARLGRLEDTDTRIEDLEREVAEQNAHATELAGSLTESRRGAAAKLKTEIESLLHELALPQARFEIALEHVDIYEGGNERVEFRLAANPGETPRPLSKVASGGELSRVALALHVVTGASMAETCVFDEVDAGVGGEAAQAVGRALARLASRSRSQVLVVTHLPQVAAYASHQYRVVKQPSGGRASVKVEQVAGPERVEELSRMLAGLPESERARRHAEELLEIAGRARP
ncbi:MAG TPA: DNA repair protein RecN [Actinomycetota bacterium]|nr:DNA repair protein RecN [Actinomycetota bacterium]